MDELAKLGALGGVLAAVIAALVRWGLGLQKELQKVQQQRVSDLQTASKEHTGALQLQAREHAKEIASILVNHAHQLAELGKHHEERAWAVGERVRVTLDTVAKALILRRDTNGRREANGEGSGANGG